MDTMAPLVLNKQFSNLSSYVLTSITAAGTTGSTNAFGNSTPEIDYTGCEGGAYVITAVTGVPNSITFYGGTGVYQPNSPGSTTTGGNALESVYAPAFDTTGAAVTQNITTASTIAPFASYTLPTSLSPYRSLKMSLSGGTQSSTAAVAITFMRQG